MNERFSGRTIIERDVMVVKEPSDSLETDDDLEETIDDDGGFAFDEENPILKRHHSIRYQLVSEAI